MTHSRKRPFASASSVFLEKRGDLFSQLKSSTKNSTQCLMKSNGLRKSARTPLCRIKAATGAVPGNNAQFGPTGWRLSIVVNDSIRHQHGLSPALLFEPPRPIEVAIGKWKCLRIQAF